MNADALQIVEVDFHNPGHMQALVQLLDHYAHDPMGGGTGLDPQVKAELPQRLAGFAGAHSWLGWGDQQPVALLNAFDGFSTFRARPLLNIHDLVVHADYRGRGLARRMLDVAGQWARQRDYCKLTLEVLSNNRSAMAAYRAAGFEAYELDPQAGQAQFWQKYL
ncbi:GNAT family N-acetyltransferase [Parathalassolituus penaei]|uniref:GNAT family N-acetyltransferase n=1 Tax=Parathalassolituus penaei TaxID=2997323 RepID=A0A9X3EME4_9GAMM|nr:GNAT family N-acetyltransferase [Parathalassolituus penaei]MCY0967036.1 GNAT family N-acetyltransferase [Parathalassolituus penaei]